MSLPPRVAAASAVLLLLLAACEPAPLLELRRAQHVSDLSSLTDAQRDALGCDPCVLLGFQRSSRVVRIAAPARADLALAAADLSAAEIREHGSLMSDERRIVDLLLVPSDSGRKALAALKAEHERADFALLHGGEVIALTSPATWPERIWIGRFRRTAEADALRLRLELPLAATP